MLIAISASAGGEHNLALKSDHTVVTWGHNVEGNLAVPIGLSNVVAISAGGTHSLALKDNGTVIAWGENSSGQAIIPHGLANVEAISAGSGHSLALIRRELQQLLNSCPI